MTNHFAAIVYLTIAIVVDKVRTKRWLHSMFKKERMPDTNHPHFPIDSVVSFRMKSVVENLTDICVCECVSEMMPLWKSVLPFG